MLGCFLANSNAQERPSGIFKIPDYTLQQDTATINELIAQSEKISSANMDSALGLLQRGYQLCKAYNLPQKKAKLLGMIGKCYLRKGDATNSILFLEMAYNEAAKTDDGKTMAMLYNAAAVLYQQQGEYANSVVNYSKALDILHKADLDKDLQTAQIYNNLGGLCVLLKEKAQALNYLFDARKILRKEDSLHTRTLAYVLTNIGLSYADSNNKLALQYLFDALPITRSQQDIYLTNKLLINISSIYLVENNFPLAIKYLQEAQATSKLLGTPLSMALTDFQAGDIYLKMKAYDDAIFYLSRSLKQSQATGFKDVILDVQLKLSEAYAATGQYQQALAYQQAFVKLKDSLQHLEKNKTIDILLKYQAAEKNKEIIKAQLELTQKESSLKEKNIWIGVISAGTLLLLALLGISIANNRHKQHLQSARLHNYEQQREIEKLRYAVEGEENERTRIARELHDGVMVRFALVKMGLNSMPRFSPLLRDHAAYKQLLKHFDQATSELRRTAHNLMPDVLLEEGIAQAIYYFCKNVEETTPLNIVFHQYGELPPLLPSFEISLYRMVQELLQNIIKHAQATRAIVQLNYGNDLLSITIEDDGCGMDLAAGDGMGLKSIRNRARIHNGSMEIQSNKDNGTAIYLEFDLLSSLSLKPVINVH